MSYQPPRRTPRGHSDYPDRPLRAQWDPQPRRATAPAPRRRSWRFYAIPVLALITVIVLIDVFRTTEADLTVAGSELTNAAPVPPTASSSDSHPNEGVVGPVPLDAAAYTRLLDSARLPEGTAYTETGDNVYRVVAGAGEQFGAGEEQVFTYSVEVEEGLDPVNYGGDDAFASMVDATLRDPRSWTQESRVGFQRIDALPQDDTNRTEAADGVAIPDVRITLASPATARQFCGYDIELEASCYNSSIGRVIINEARWVRGALSFAGDIGSYRQYVINHEVGHAIGYAHHQPCAENGGLAPIMMQQTFGTKNNIIFSLDPEGVVPEDGKECRYNPWPYPAL